jgi:hypothetical protein
VRRFRHGQVCFASRIQPTCPTQPTQPTCSTQGMSAAAVCARILEHCLDEYGIANLCLSKRFFSAQARFQTTPCLFAAGDDLRFPATVGKRTWSVRLLNSYRLNAIACPDRRVGARLAEVTQFVRPRSSLFAPQILSSVARATVSGKLTRSRGEGLLMPLASCHLA